MGTCTCITSGVVTALTDVVVGGHLTHGHGAPRPLFYPPPPEAAYAHSNGLRFLDRPLCPTSTQ